MPKKLLWALEYIFLCLVFALASILPERWLEAMGRGLGRFVFRHVGARRQVVLDNLEHAFPERDVLTLRVVHGLTFREVAAALEITEEAAKKRGQRGLRRLRKHVTAAREAAPDAPPSRIAL